MRAFVRVRARICACVGAFVRARVRLCARVCARARALACASALAGVIARAEGLVGVEGGAWARVQRGQRIACLASPQRLSSTHARHRDSAVGMSCSL